MRPNPIESDTASALGRAAHQIGIGAILGGNLFARVGMHPALTEIASPTERGRVLNRSWRRYGSVNSAALIAIVGGWAAARANEAAPSKLSAAERPLAAAKDAAVGAVAVTGIASGLAGMRFAAMEPDGAVALADGDHAAASADPEERRAKRLIRRLADLHLASAVALAGIDAALAQTTHRRPPVRRMLRR